MYSDVITRKHWGNSLSAEVTSSNSLQTFKTKRISHLFLASFPKFRNCYSVCKVSEMIWHSVHFECNVTADTIYHVLLFSTKQIGNSQPKHVWQSLAETWCKFWGDGVSALAPKIFFAVPLECEIWGGRRGTHCLLETNVGSVLSCIDAVTITIYFTL